MDCGCSWIYQDISQIEKTYGRDEWITKNCGSVIFSTLSDTGYDLATKMCGTMIAPMRARHRKIGVLERQSETASQSRHPVLNPRDARLMTKDHALVVRRWARGRSGSTSAGGGR